MQYESIILELLSRIQKLEDELALLKQALNGEPVSSNDELSYEKSNSYKKTTDEMLDLCYQYGKKVHNGENVKTLAANIAKKTNMNYNSSIIYLYAVSAMLDGTIYKRAISTKAIQKYFDNIFHEYGTEGLRKALHATRLHINYRKDCGHSVDSLEELCDKTEQKL